MNEEQFNDPLADFDPVMESAFSVNEDESPASESSTIPAENSR